MKSKKEEYRSSRLLYSISAALEYFITILVGTAYLAKLAGAIGISDGTVGILSSFISLGCGFQIISLFMRTDRPVKTKVVIVNLLNQICFSLLYVIPVVDLSGNAKTVLFVTLLLLGNVLTNAVFSPKIVWSRRLVDDHERGAFTAKYQIFSLVSGMIFTVVMGRIIDGYEAVGNLEGSFIATGITLFTLTALHAICLLFMAEPPSEESDERNVASTLRDALTDRATLKLLPLFILWNAAVYMTTPFFGTYQINELGFSMTAVAVLSAAYAILRSLVSVPIGTYGDRTGFIRALNLAFAAMAVGLIVNSLGGAVCHVIYYLLYGVTLAGTANALINIIYDYVPKKNRSSAVSILYAVGGIFGFFVTVAVKPLVDTIQRNNDTFLFIEGVYAQQVLSVFGALVTVACIVYSNVIIKKMPKISK